MTKKGKPARDPAEKSKYAARCATLSEVNSSAIIETFGKGLYGNTSGQEAYELLQTLTTKGDTIKLSERMLLSQAHALDVMFANLARRAASNIGQDRLPVVEAYMRLALRAQNQARMTLETLATIKNPPVVFAKQANIAHGHQQVNNGDGGVSAGIARAGENGNAPNEQSRLTHDSGQSLDFGASAATGAGNPPLEAVAAVHRPANG
jgi:hypothetical protein